MTLTECKQSDKQVYFMCTICEQKWAKVTERQQIIDHEAQMTLLKKDAHDKIAAANALVSEHQTKIYATTEKYNDIVRKFNSMKDDHKIIKAELKLLQGNVEEFAADKCGELKKQYDALASELEQQKAMNMTSISTANAERLQDELVKYIVASDAGNLEIKRLNDLNAQLTTSAASGNAEIKKLHDEITTHTE